jgi:protoporphyrinogen oxidase
MPEKIVIVGGGFTGLTAAYDLARSPGRPDITLLDAGEALGGLAAGFSVCGTSLEKSYHYLLLGDADILALARELGLDGDVMYRTGSVGIYDGDRLHPFSTPIDLLRFPPLRFADRLRLGQAMWRLQRMRDWSPLASQTAREWLTRACGPAAMRAVWDPLLHGKFDRHAGEVSMAWLWARIHTRANSRVGAREQLAYPRGGFVRMVQRIEEEFARAGVRVRTGERVQHLEMTPQRRLRLVNGEALAFDRCLFTGPSDAFARLLPETPELDGFRRQLQSIAYLGAICVVLVTDQPLGRHHWVNVHDAAAPFLVFINHTALVGTEHYQGRYVYYLGCYRPHDSPWFGKDDAALLDEWLAYLGRMFPAFDPARLQERHVFRFRNAQHVVDCDYERKIPGFRTPLPGVYLANFSQIFPYDRGTNFAVRDGRRIAAMMLADGEAAP